jgi:type IV pilus assembly protein PilA
MKMNLKKGFTLIELLVVVAIIGILASVVLASLTTARSKGKDAAIQAQLANMRAQAELYYSTTGGNSYGPVHAVATACTGATDLFGDTAANNSLLALITGATSSGGTLKCASGAASGNATSWAVSSVSASSATTYFCVDSTGFSGSGAKQATGGGTSAAVCN